MFKKVELTLNYLNYFQVNFVDQKLTGDSKLYAEIWHDIG